MNIFKGAFTALITPMNADGSVDFDGFRKNVKYQLECSSQYVPECCIQ